MAEEPAEAKLLTSWQPGRTEKQSRELGTKNTLQRHVPSDLLPPMSLHPLEFPTP